MSKQPIIFGAEGAEVKLLKGRKFRVRVLRDIYVRIDSMGLEFTIPTGFECDLISAPWYVRWLISTVGPARDAAIAHDYLYATGLVSKAEADQAFLILMERVGVPIWQRTAMWLAVKRHGDAAWIKCRARASL